MISNKLIAAASFTPNSLKSPNAWVGHLPFAAWVIQEVSPRIFVELGTHTGNSYFSFCQSVVEAGISSKCYAIDTWHGDEHAGQYNDDIFLKVNAQHQERYAEFSRLLRMTFDDAIGYFSDESIELLHIDGLHTYEAVRHDFETWLPKLAPGAIVMFHDTNVRERNFGVWRLWEELQARYPNNLEFVHSHGLGVLQLNNATDDKKLEWLQPSSPEKQKLINYFAALGTRQLERFELGELKERASNLNQTISEQDERISAYHHAVLGRDEQIASLSEAMVERDEQIASLSEAMVERDEQIASLSQAVVERDRVVSQMFSSTSWSVTYPLRAVKFIISNSSRTYKNTRRGKKFDAVWYLKKNPDVATSGMDSYEHYKSFGKAEGRQPGPDTSLQKNSTEAIFSATRQRSIDIVKFFYKRLPFTQSLKTRARDYCYRRFPFLFHGEPSYEFWLARKARSANGNLVGGDVDLGLMLPATVAKSRQGATPPWGAVDVIVPVYRGLEQTRRCINSVLNSTVITPFRLIVINDASPEIEVTEYLRSLTAFHQVIIVENAENLGFTATVNRGMNWSDANDVLLLNSDAEVANDWLDKIKAHAYSDARVGSVTPFSNNATICNYPTLDGMKELPASESVQSLDAAFASANIGRNIEIPTAVGFCMYIRRDCLNEVGLFDVETFGKGYGEENDFCLRATAQGWKHLLAADTFVFHEGEVSFQAESNPRKELAMNILRQRHPKYETDVARHIARNEAYPLRVAATAARFRQAGVPVVLHVLHAHGGGTQKHVEELCLRHRGKAKQLIMIPPFPEAGKTALQIRSADPEDALDINLSIINLDFLVPLIRSFGVSLLHIHHVLGYSFDLRYFVENLKVPFYLTVHDYMLICPRIYLMPVGEKYCGEPEPSKCNQCLSVEHPLGASDIEAWRNSHAWLFNEASVVICPSHDVAQRCQRYFPHAFYRIVPHELALGDPGLDINVPALDEKSPLRVAILGAIGPHKGSKLIEEMLIAVQKNKAPLRFQLIGYADTKFASVPSEYFSQTGPYTDAELMDKINIFDPHLILFSSRCPETYSYTLTAALKSKRPVIVPNLGAFPERVALRPWTWLIDWDSSATQLVDKLCEVRVNNFCTRTAPPPPEKKGLDQSVAIEDKGFYDRGYMPVGHSIEGKRIIDISTPGKITALVLIENGAAQPSPCSYIRLILPLSRERGEKFDLRWVTLEQVTDYAADILICQRTTVTSIGDIEKIVSHCQDNDIRIVYDLDDLLMALPEDHPENAIYAHKSAAVLRWLLEADEVWVSTKALQDHVCPINPRTHVVPNYIDDNLWIKPKLAEVNDQRNEPVRLLYMGTQTHNADFELVKNVLKRLKNEFGERVEINLIGVITNDRSETWYKNIIIPHSIGCVYPLFVNWLCNQPTFDIGIAPLVENEFNHCKSAIKFLDYSALGLATVASDITGYALIRNEENGFRVKNTEESWYEVLKTLITDSSLRSKIQSTAQNEVFVRYGYRSVVGDRTRLLTSLLSKDAKKVRNAQENILKEYAINLERPTAKVGRNTIASAFLSGVGIEVGALHNPLPVPSDAKVKYVDRMDKPGLYEQYPELRQHNLVDVDFVDNGETLLTFAENSQDFIIANHFLEYCEDPIATLKAFFRVLRTGGVVFLALPDKRFTFDKNRQRTSLDHLIHDHLDGPVASRFEHFREWPEFVEPHFGRLYATAEEIENRARELMSQNYSIHYHVWEPQDVHEMLLYCADEQGLPLEIEYFISEDDEMIFILRKKVCTLYQATIECPTSRLNPRNVGSEHVAL